MDAWIAKLAAVKLPNKFGRTALFRTLLPVVLQSIAVYSVYRVVRWSRTKRDSKGSTLTSSTVSAKEKNVNKEREAGGMVAMCISLKASSSLTMEVQFEPNSLDA
ncbi:hypothetical protein BDN67DRAFT_952599 [Paxillus ammoniavirescens]|nr:hypothetical protein BDN67DRAFT_952599 [Paxillus ammoniavirescens]